MVKCNKCGNELKSLKGKYKFSAQINVEKEFNLSEGIEPVHSWDNTMEFSAIPFVDVKEFIERLKMYLSPYDDQNIKKIIDKLAGDKLISQKKDNK